MATSFNSITLVGFLGREPESRYTPSGDLVTDFSLATSERRKDGQESTTWFRINAWGKLAEVASQYLHKGSYVYVEGPLAQREYTGNDGALRTALEVRARAMKMLDKRGEEEPAAASTGTPAPVSPDLTDLPF